MYNRPLISLCIPTNGVIHWVFPVLDSIYAQGVEEELFEVVVCDNGDNDEFKDKIKYYRDNHQNFVYAETDAPVFLSEPKAYKLASGKFIKFINHRTMLRDGALKYYLDFIYCNQNKVDRPIIYFSNGELKQKKNIETFSCFDEFIKNLKIYSTWSTGIAMWKDDFDELPDNTVYNALFPHTTILFQKRQRDIYIIDDTVLLSELPVGETAKGSYDVFYAFAVEYLYILLGLFRDGNISSQTFLYLKSEIKRFCADLYIDFVIRKKWCSYYLDGFSDAINIFFNITRFKWYCFYRIGYRMLIKSLNMINKLLNVCIS